MEIREYISIRRAYNLVRQEKKASERLAFEEFAILAHLASIENPLKTSEIAEYQDVLRPTMTHRTNHLDRLGLISRKAGSVDHRNVVCSISRAGGKTLFALADEVCEKIGSGQSLNRITSDRLLKYIDAMGALDIDSGELLLLSLYADGEAKSISRLVTELGLLQPTVSMAVRSLEKQGFVERKQATRVGAKSVRITKTGATRARAKAARIDEIVVRRRKRS